MAQGARAPPERELDASIGGGRRYQLDDGAAAIGRDRSFKKSGGFIAAQPLLEKIIAGQRHPFPAFPQLTHVSIMTPDVPLRLVKMVG